MRQKLREYALLTSLLGIVVTSLLWIRSVVSRDELWLDLGDRVILIRSVPHHLHLFFGTPAYYRNIKTQFYWNERQIRSRPQYFEVRFSRDAGATEIYLPFWLILTACLPIPLARLSHWHRLRRHQREGLCIHCGYDLRAATGRCPECGTEFISSTAINRLAI